MLAYHVIMELAYAYDISITKDYFLAMLWFRTAFYFNA
jgi:uncharacterized protein YaiI (UPF0178 family)